MDFFSACKTQDEAKATFRKLAKVFHSDISGGNNDLMRELIKQHDAWKPTNNFSQKINDPFDHPLQETIRSMEAQITGLNAKISMIECINADLQRHAHMNKIELEQWKSNALEYGQTIREQKARIETLREIIDNKPKTLWQYLKNLWEEI